MLLLWTAWSPAVIAFMVMARFSASQTPFGSTIMNASSSSGSVPTMTMNQIPGSQNVVVAPTTLIRTNLTLVNPLAVCNDGTPGFYYFRPGTGSDNNKWVILFEGGGFCSDQQTCTLRASATANLMTSGTQYYPDTLSGAAVGGVLDGDVRANPNMYTWNHVWVGYCSSDSYLGNAGPGDTTETGAFQFRGQQIANATILSLLATKNLGTATDILLVGVSAGAVGVLNLADDIYSTLKPKAPALVNFKAYIDAGWFLDIPSYSQASSAFTFRKTAQGLFNNFKASFNQACMEAYPRQEWACFFAQYAWAYVQTPLIFHEYLYDGASLGFDAATSQDNLNDFRTRLTKSLATPANAVPSVRNDSASAASPSVSTRSVTSSSPAPNSGASSIMNAGTTLVDGIGGIASPLMQGIPPAPLPQTLTPSAPGAPPPPNPPRVAPQATNASGLPTTAPLGSAALPSVFAPACNNHNIADNDLFSVSHIGITRFTDVLDTWFTNGTSWLPLIDPTVGLGSAIACLRAA